MACCLVLLRLLAPASHRLGFGETTRPPGLPVVPIALLGVVEGIAAILLVRQLGDGGSAHVHGAVAGAGASGVTLGEACAVVVAALVVVLGVRWAGRARTPTALAGAATVIGAAVVAGGGAAASSHAVMMLVVDAALVVGPVAVVGVAADRRPADDVWVVVRCGLALVAAALAAFLLVTLHLPATHGWYLWSGGLDWWLVPLLAATGLCFWSSVLRFRLPPAWRALLLVGVLETGAVIGLALLLAGDVLLPTTGAAALGALSDQRLAGGLMMLVDLALLVRVVEPVLRPAGARAAESAALAG